MNIIRRIGIVIAFFGILVVNVIAQPMEKRHQIGFRGGLWNQVSGSRTEVGIGGVKTTVESNGPLGGISYGHWFQENLAITIDAGIMGLKIETNSGVYGVTAETAVVTNILFGAKYYFLKSSYGSSVKPYAKANIGAFIGSQEKETVQLEVIVESRTETTMGGQLGAGVDILLHKYIMAEIALGYNLMSDFGQPIGGSKNYSGPEFSVGLSLVI